MPKRKREISPKEDAESFGYVGAFAGFIVAYLSAEALLAVRPHPIHWVVALTGALLVGAATYGVILWQQTRRRPR